MTLRTRLTLFYTLLVTLILVISGFVLHVLFQRSLQNNFDTAMSETSQLILSTLLEANYDSEDDEVKGYESESYESDEGLDIHIDPSSFPIGLSAFVTDNSGKALVTLSGNPNESSTENTSNNVSLYWLANDGFYQKDNKRVLVSSIPNTRSLKLILSKQNNSIQQTLRQFDRLFLLLLPLAILSSLLLGHLLARQALTPVDRLTKAAYDLANRRAWRERLPEPKTQDELWRLGAATNTLLKSLQEVIESERRFTADAAHELRTPLTVLQGRLEQTIEATDPTDTTNRPRLLKAHEASQQLLTLVEKLLLLARTEAGQGLQKEKVALDEVAFHTANDLRPLFDAKGLKLKLILPEEEATINGDRVALSLLIKNLLENALKFTEKGQVKLSVIKKHNQQILTIQDTGKGIPKEALPHLFDRFYQSDITHRQKGSGLGLALVKSIVDWHGGTISVENIESGGTQFSISLGSI